MIPALDAGYHPVSLLHLPPAGNVTLLQSLWVFSKLVSDLDIHANTPES